MQLLCVVRSRAGQSSPAWPPRGVLLPRCGQGTLYPYMPGPSGLLPGGRDLCCLSEGAGAHSLAQDLAASPQLPVLLSWSVNALPAWLLIGGAGPGAGEQTV